MTSRERQSWIASFLELSTGNVADAMDSLGLARGALQGLHPLNPGQPKAAGFAFTIKQCRRRSRGGEANLARQGAIIDSETQYGDMLVIDMSGIREVCTGGSILALRAKMRGVSGELTNGCLRDAGEISVLGFPVYCAGTSPVKSALDVETVGVNIPVSVGGIQICPEDFILMDSTGIVAVPSEHLDGVKKAAQSIAAREEQMTAMIREGKSLAEVRRIPREVPAEEELKK